MTKFRRQTSPGTGVFLAAWVLLGGAAGSLICLRPELAERMGFGRETMAQVLLPEAVLLGVLIAAPFFRRARGITAAALAAKGALLALQTAVPMVQQGTRGWVHGLVLGLLPGFFTLTAMLLLARQTVLYTAAGRKRAWSPDAAFLVTACVGAVTVVLAACTRLFLLPPLWGLMERLFP